MKNTPPVDDKLVVKNYFNGTGFNRWRNIYGTGEVNQVQADIRAGHQRTIATVLEWLPLDLNGITIADVGCGTGSLTLPLAHRGAQVRASDISLKMVQEAKNQALSQRDFQSQFIDQKIEFLVADLEELRGTYHTVICLDVLIHYPAQHAQKMLQHLASCATHRLIFSFAPKTLFYSALKKVGSLFPGASKATRAYLHPGPQMTQTITALGWNLRQCTQIKSRFYFACLLDFVRPNDS
ncbi:Mg-protoporphyrin IX methyl transferase [Gloeomargarita lithophora Alchichica-D10]|uniref:Magnesium protoporphyrin IX methyltransferase n=1 Tax=Gloeomargarita lithophora Alchichica-D10 TaxID=1188229 RepID=A0A1J0AEC7_9CYAN|nr:magnesium protoporphyrin IX methyltransferase [Gloeomargarita lithophora]APB34285.1 Mg-protoporphyrin IX methyl transferase [Gloeomargarita lithophora Alchichica-D10]